MAKKKTKVRIITQQQVEEVMCNDGYLYYKKVTENKPLELTKAGLKKAYKAMAKIGDRYGNKFTSEDDKKQQFMQGLQYIISIVNDDYSYPSNYLIISADKIIDHAIAYVKEARKPKSISYGMVNQYATEISRGQKKALLAVIGKKKAYKITPQFIKRFVSRAKAIARALGSEEFTVNEYLKPILLAILQVMCRGDNNQTYDYYIHSSQSTIVKEMKIFNAYYKIAYKN